MLVNGYPTKKIVDKNGTCLSTAILQKQHCLLTRTVHACQQLSCKNSTVCWQEQCMLVNSYPAKMLVNSYPAKTALFVGKNSACWSIASMPKKKKLCWQEHSW